MMGWLRFWWKNTSKPLRAAVIISHAILIVLLIGGYFLNWDWTGFGPYTLPTKDSNFQREKTLWDWLQLFFIPAAIAFGVWWLNRLQQQRDEQLAVKRAQTERDIALDNQREAALQAYLDNMSELLVEKKLRESTDDDEVRKIGRVRTLTVLPRLDPGRKRIVLQFLHESGLIDKESIS